MRVAMRFFTLVGAARSCWLLLGCALISAGAREASASSYFSATGTFTAPTGQSEQFNFSLASNSNPQNTLFQTMAHAGGTNASGQLIPAGGIDSILTLFDASNTQIARNDDRNDNTIGQLDSLLLSPGGGASGSSVLPPLTAGSYRLALTNFGSNIGNGAWAVDLASAIDTMTVTAITPSANSILNSLSFGASSGATLSLNSNVTTSITGTLSMGQLSTLNVATGTLAVGSAFNMNGASVVQDGGYVSTGSVWVLRMTSFGLLPSKYTLNDGTLFTNLGINFGEGSGGAASFTQNGGTVDSATGNLILAIGSGSAVTYTLNGGHTSAGGMYAGYSFGSVGTLVQNGGSLTGSVFAAAASPSSTGRYLMNGGTSSFGEGFIGGVPSGQGGVGSFSIYPGATASFSGPLRVYPGSNLSVLGGTLNAATINHSGGGQVVFSSGTVNLTSSNLTVGGLGLLGANISLPGNKALLVSGAATIQNGAVLSIDGGTFAAGSITSFGQLQFNSGTLKLTNSDFTVGAAGLLGPTVALNAGQTLHVSSALRAAVIEPLSLLSVSGGQLQSAGSIQNNGQILLGGSTSTLVGRVVNSGLISGSGRSVGSFLNTSTGRVQVGAADNLRIVGQFDNSGSVTVLGGTLDVTGAYTENRLLSLDNGLLHAQLLAVSPTGRIIGHGNLQADLGTSNGGSVTFTGGDSSISGAVTNFAGSKMIVTGGSTSTFYDSVANNAGSEFRVSTGSTAVFLGSVTGTGAFTGQGVKIFEAGGSLGPVDTDGASIVSAGATLTMARVREVELEVNGLARISANGTNSGTSRLNSHRIAGSSNAWTGKLDLADNDLVLDYDGATPLPTVKNQIRAAYAGGAWSGNGITSSLANASNLGLGYGENAQLGFTTFSGVLVDATAVLIKYTRYGDADLDGDVDLDDVGAWSLNFTGELGGAGTKFWHQGDWDYDGDVDLDDVGKWSLNFTGELGGGLAHLVLPASIDPVAADALRAMGIAVVPEPASLVAFFAIISAASCCTRRSRRSR